MWLAFEDRLAYDHPMTTTTIYHTEPKAVRLCVVCGARVTNRNPFTKTCSPDCTAELHKRSPEAVHITSRCLLCGIALLNGHDLCDWCEGERP